jgi:hypothetical protein
LSEEKSPPALRHGETLQELSEEKSPPALRHGETLQELSEEKSPPALRLVEPIPAEIGEEELVCPTFRLANEDALVCFKKRGSGNRKKFTPFLRVH